MVIRLSISSCTQSMSPSSLYSRLSKSHSCLYTERFCHIILTFFLFPSCTSSSSAYFPHPRMPARVRQHHVIRASAEHGRVEEWGTIEQMPRQSGSDQNENNTGDRDAEPPDLNNYHDDFAIKRLSRHHQCSDVEWSIFIIQISTYFFPLSDLLFFLEAVLPTAFSHAHGTRYPRVFSPGLSALFISQCSLTGQAKIESIQS